MRIYLSARYPRAAEMREARDKLVALGHEITSTWHDDDVPDVKRSTFVIRAWAERDLLEIEQADLFVAFTEEPDSIMNGARRGGRHAEFGFALGLTRWHVIIGPREHVIHYTDGVPVFKTLDVAIKAQFGTEEGDDDE